MTKTHQSLVAEYREKFDYSFGLLPEKDAMWEFTEKFANAAARGVEEIANKEVSDYRQHLCFLYRWISRLNGDKSHDTPEKQWREYVAVMVNYPSAPYQTRDWFEDDEPKSPQLKKYLGEV